jgi:hypothetical protein
VNNPVKTVIPTVILGWREWVALPDLGLPAIKAKIDTGAKTSALHAFRIQRFKHNGVDWLKFGIHPLQLNQSIVRECKAPLLDQRTVTDSGGHEEERFVIQTQLSIGNDLYPVELTLTDRDDMRFRMLLGRQGILKHMLVDASASFLLKRLNARKLYTR